VSFINDHFIRYFAYCRLFNSCSEKQENLLSYYHLIYYVGILSMKILSSKLINPTTCLLQSRSTNEFFSHFTPNHHFASLQKILCTTLHDTIFSCARVQSGPNFCLCSVGAMLCGVPPPLISVFRQGPSLQHRPCDRGVAVWTPALSYRARSAQPNQQVKHRVDGFSRKVCHFAMATFAPDQKTLHCAQKRPDWHSM